MKFKSPWLEPELHKACTMIQFVANWFEQLSVEYFAIEPTITRVFESIQGATLTHPEGRAVDIRDEHDGKHVYSPEQIKFLVSEMNRRFPWKGMDCALWHSFKGGPYHFHLQIPRGFERAPDNVTNEKDSSTGGAA